MAQSSCLSSYGVAILKESKTIINTLKAFTEIVTGHLTNANTLEMVTSALSQVAKDFGIIGAAIGLAGCFTPLPDIKHEEMLNELAKLNMILIPDVRAIKNGIDLLKEATSESATERDEQRLVEKCSAVEDAVDNLLNVLTGEEEFGVGIILDQYYEVTRGDMHAINRLSRGLFTLIAGGMAVVSAYETIKGGSNVVEKIIKKFEKKLKKSNIRVEAVNLQCKQNFESNMEKDLEEILQQHKDKHKDLLCRIIYHFMAKKYDWVSLKAMVWLSKHFSVCGSYFFKTESENQFVVFYLPRDKLIESLRLDEKLSIAKTLIKRVETYNNAGEAADYIKSELKKMQIEYWAIACIEKDSAIFSIQNTASRLISGEGEYLSITIMLK